MSKKKLLLIVLLSLSLLAISFAGGTYFGWHYVGKGSRAIERLFAMAAYSQYVSMEYQEANYPDAKKALLDFIAILDEANKLPSSDYYDYRTSQVDAMLSYARIAMLEERNGNLGEYEKFMKEATKRCENVKWKDCSSHKIRQFVEHFDRNGLILNLKRHNNPS